MTQRMPPRLQKRWRLEFPLSIDAGFTAAVRRGPGGSESCGCYFDSRCRYYPFLPGGLARRLVEDLKALTCPLALCRGTPAILDARPFAGACPVRFSSAALPRKKHVTRPQQWLSPGPNLAQDEKYGYFEVMGGNSGKHYRIRPTRQMNVDDLKLRCADCRTALRPRRRPSNW